MQEKVLCVVRPSSRLLRSGRVCEMESLGHRSDEQRFDSLPLEHHLLIVESQHRVAKQHEPGIGIHISAASGLRAVMLEAVYLDDEAFADQEVDRVPVDPYLLTYADGQVSDSREEDRFQPESLSAEQASAIRRARRLRQSTPASTPVWTSPRRTADSHTVSARSRGMHSATRRSVLSRWSSAAC